VTDTLDILWQTLNSGLPILLLHFFITLALLGWVSAVMPSSHPSASAP
jgi:hypothetical protein